MNEIRQITVVSLSIFLLLVASCESSQSPLKIKKGQAVLELPVTDINGVPVRLKLATDKFTILNVWATWCGPCRHEMPSLDRMAGLLDKNKVEVIGLSIDTDDYVVREFLIERKVGFKNYMDPAMDIVNNIFGVRVFPSTFVFSPKGELIEVIEGWKEWDTTEMINRMNGLVGGN